MNHKKICKISHNFPLSLYRFTLFFYNSGREGGGVQCTPYGPFSPLNIPLTVELFHLGGQGALQAAGRGLQARTIQVNNMAVYYMSKGWLMEVSLLLRQTVSSDWIPLIYWSRRGEYSLIIKDYNNIYFFRTLNSSSHPSLTRWVDQIFILLFKLFLSLHCLFFSLLHLSVSSINFLPFSRFFSSKCLLCYKKNIEG